MDTAELRTFLAVANCGSFSQASLKLGLPQNTVGRRIGRLEDELGGSLFDRKPSGASLTPLGHQLCVETEALIHVLDDARNAIINQNSEASGLVRLGIPPSVGRGIAASIAASFRSQYPNAQLYIMEALSGTLAEWLEAGIVDIAILYDERRSPNMSVEPLLREDLVLVGRPGSLPDINPVAIPDIDLSRLILHSKGEGLRRAIDAACASVGITLSCSVEIDSIATLKLLVEGGDALTVLPHGTVLRELEEGRLAIRRIALPANMTALLVVGTALSRPVTKSARALLKIINEQSPEFVRAADLPLRGGR